MKAVNANLKKRLFFAAQVEAPWPSNLPSSRLIPEETRHITLSFLGSVLFSNNTQIPTPIFTIGPCGYCPDLLFLPAHTPRVVATSVQWLTQEKQILDYHEKLVEWLHTLNYDTHHSRFFHPHISLARGPFDVDQWEKLFFPFPFFVKAIHLYESQPELQYTPVWTHPLHPPFEEIEHTADIAFLIRGTSLEELYLHALLSLSFHCSSLQLQKKTPPLDSLDAIIIQLNKEISLLDRLHGSPFKAVSFHGCIQRDELGLLNWEMIVDV